MYHYFIYISSSGVNCLILTVSKSSLQFIQVINSPNWFLWQISFKYLRFANIMICPLVSLQNFPTRFLAPFTATVSPRGWGFMIGLLSIGTTTGAGLLARTGVFLKGDLVRHSFWCRTTIFLSMFFGWVWCVEGGLFLVFECFGVGWSFFRF